MEEWIERIVKLLRAMKDKRKLEQIYWYIEGVMTNRW